MPLIPIKIPPGFYRNATQYQAKNRWYNGNLIRFSEGRLRPIGGWQRLAPSQIVKRGAVRELTITSAGSGYSGNVDIKFTPPVGVGTTAAATATVTNGAVTSTTITNIGLGYTFTNPPLTIIELPAFQTEKINTIENVEGYTGIITGIQQTTRSGGGPALRFFFNAVTQNSSGVLANVDADKLKVGYPILVTGTKVGNGLTSINGVNASVVCI